MNKTTERTEIDWRKIESLAKKEDLPCSQYAEALLDCTF
jgi:hypothetical protein